MNILELLALSQTNPRAIVRVEYIHAGFRFAHSPCAYKESLQNENIVNLADSRQVSVAKAISTTSAYRGECTLCGARLDKPYQTEQVSWI